MGEMIENLESAGRWIHSHRGLLLPIAAAALIFAILVPLPPALMDVLLVGNIALAAIILLTTIHVSSPLDFSVFPSLLLGATLIRLVLNVASTRLILTAGAQGRTLPEAQVAAGDVIWAFSHFVTLGSLEVGVILFAIIAVIQFVVVTRGAARISEVAARFVLDAMPGKQMAIDADLNTGLIDEGEAHRRRGRIAGEADFYGAMDGASKFLRGDAVAAVIITLVNILGGLYVGMVQYGWGFSRTLGLFTRLTIGDGLVTQVPAFLVAISAALIVTRSTAKSNLGEEVLSQLTRRPVALVITAIFLVALTLTSLPKAPLLLLGLGCAGLAWILLRRGSSERPEETIEPDHGALSRSGTGEGQVVDSLLTVDPLQIELGYTLVDLTNASDGSLLRRIGALRREIAAELGLPVPPVRINDEMRIDCETYVIRIRGVKVASGRLHARKLLALSDEEVAEELPGLAAIEPTFGTPAIWIARSQREHAEALNYTIVEPAAVLTTHLREIVRIHAAQLLNRQQVVKLLDNLKDDAGNLVQEARDRFSTGQIQRVLQSLLRERVPIRDLETILETMCDAPEQTSDTGELTELVRRALGGMLTQQYCGEDGKLWCISLDPGLAEEISGRVEKGERGGTVMIAPPERARRIAEAVADGLARVVRQGRRPVLLCDPRVRAPLRRMIAPLMPDAAVLAYSEVDSVEVQSVGSVGIE